MKQTQRVSQRKLRRTTRAERSSASKEIVRSLAAQLARADSKNAELIDRLLKAEQRRIDMALELGGIKKRLVQLVGAECMILNSPGERVVQGDPRSKWGHNGIFPPIRTVEEAMAMLDIKVVRDNVSLCRKVIITGEHGHKRFGVSARMLNTASDGYRALLGDYLATALVSVFQQSNTG